jgi:hypothetical protein
MYSSLISKPKYKWKISERRGCTKIIGCEIFKNKKQKNPRNENLTFENWMWGDHLSHRRGESNLISVPSSQKWLTRTEKKKTNESLNFSQRLWWRKINEFFSPVLHIPPLRHISYIYESTHTMQLLRCVISGGFVIFLPFSLLWAQFIKITYSKSPRWWWGVTRLRRQKGKEMAVLAQLFR